MGSPHLAALHPERCIGVDFETKPIEALPAPPPVPVGLAVHHPGKKVKYLAWGHPTGNNCSKADARRELLAIRRGKRPVIGHNFIHFDNPVMEVEFDIPRFEPERIVDSLACAFLCDPNEKNLGLKPLQEKWLGVPAHARDVLREWILDNVPGAKRAPTKWGRFICRAPGDLTAAYASGDATAPKQLVRHMLEFRGLAEMLEALEMEQWWLHQSVDMERRGVPIAHRRLRRDVKRGGLKDAPSWDTSIDRTESWIRHRLRAPSINLNSGEQVADRLEELQLVDTWEGTDDPAWFLTKTGKRSTKHEHLRIVCADDDLVAAMRYRNLMRGYRKTFALEWLRQSDLTGGYCHFGWNTVRKPKADGTLDSSDQVGARTGRMSSNPNAQNLPKRPRALCFTMRAERDLVAAKFEAIRLPRALRGRVCMLPNLRDYIMAPPSQSIIDRDFMGQELRILAHLAGGRIAKAFHEDPFLDFHQWVTDFVNAELGTSLGRGQVKNVNFAIIYQAGLVKLASMMGLDVTEDEASVVRRAVKQALPELRAVERRMKGLEAKEEALWTIGGRRYFTEPPTYNDDPMNPGFGGYRSWAYKNLNTYIQGGAGDQTKRFGRNYAEMTGRPPLILVHDQGTDLVETGREAEAHTMMREAMEGGTQDMLDVPVISDGSWSKRSWGSLRKWNDRRGERAA